MLAFVLLADKLDMDMFGKLKARLLRNRTKSVYRQIFQLLNILHAAHYLLDSFIPLINTFVHQVVPLPDSSRLLKVLCAHLIITQLSLQVCLMQELFDKGEEHWCVSVKEILNFVRWHELWMVRCLERPLDEVVRAFHSD